MPRLLTRSIVLVAVVCAEIVLGQPAALARGADPCPEPNDTFQAACYLGAGADAVGFVSTTEDVDAYRFEALDFGATVRLELAETSASAPYRLHLADWNGRVIAESSSQGGAAVLEHTLGPPGSYYAFVDSRGGESSDTVPYRLTTRLGYVGSAPKVAYANEFRSGQKDLCNVGPVSRWTGCEARDGKFVVWYQNEGVTNSPGISIWGGWGPHVSDFTMVSDVRIDGNPDRHQVNIGFRSTVEQIDRNWVLRGYRLQIAPTTGITSLRKFRGDDRGDLLRDGDRLGIDLRPLAPLDPTGVNRIVVRCLGPEIIVNVNGVEALRLYDDWFSSGSFAYGVGMYGAFPVPLTYFDNALVTTP